MGVEGNCYPESTLEMRLQIPSSLVRIERLPLMNPQLSRTSQAHIKNINVHVDTHIENGGCSIKKHISLKAQGNMAFVKKLGVVFVHFYLIEY